MTGYFYLLFNGESAFDIALYTLLLFVATFLGYKSQRSTRQGIRIFDKRFYFAAYLILAFFYVFNDTGVDLEQYRYIYTQSTKFADIYHGGVEVGYQYLMIFLNFITPDPIVGVAIIRGLQISLVFISIYLLRDRIHIGLAIMAYVTLFYFESFALLRSSLSGSLCLLSFALLSKEKKNWMAILFAVMAFLFHNSSLVFIIAIILFLLADNIPFLYKHRNLFVLLATVVSVIVIINGSDYIKIFLEARELNEGRYDGYIIDGGTDFGVFVIAKYIVVFFLMYRLSTQTRYTKQNRRWYDLNLVFTIAGCVIAFMSYQIGMLTRMAIFFGSTFLFMIPSSVACDLSTQKRALDTLCFLYFFYLFMNNISGCYYKNGLFDFSLL